MSTDLHDIDISIESNDFIQLYKQLRVMIKGDVTTTKLILLTTRACQLVERMKGIHGTQKRDIVVNLFKKVIMNKVEDEEEQAELLLFVEMTLPPVIDTLIAIDKRELVIKLQKHCGCLPRKK